MSIIIKKVELKCEHCKQKVKQLHQFKFEDRICLEEAILEGTHTRFGELCDQCWFEMMEFFEKYSKPK